MLDDPNSNFKHSNRKWGGALPVESILRGETNKRNKATAYVCQYSFYDSAVAALPPAIRRAVLVAGSHTQTTPPDAYIRSTEYINRVRDYLIARGFTSVELRLGHPPDDDVVYMANAAHFVRSGGGFSYLCAALVRMLGGRTYWWEQAGRA